MIDTRINFNIMCPHCKRINSSVDDSLINNKSYTISCLYCKKIITYNRGYKMVRWQMIVGAVVLLIITCLLVALPIIDHSLSSFAVIWSVVLGWNANKFYRKYKITKEVKNG